jgi:hypothetical protein
LTLGDLLRDLLLGQVIPERLGQLLDGGELRSKLVQRLLGVTI